MVRKYLFLLCLILVLLPVKVEATTVTHRQDGTFLIDNEPYFPIGFNPGHLVYDINQSEWNEIKNSGFNMTIGVWQEPFSTYVRNTGMKQTYILPYDFSSHTSDDWARIVAIQVRNIPNLFTYYAYDEPVLQLNLQVDTAAAQNYYRMNTQIVASDSAHPIWTNHSVAVHMTEQEYMDKMVYWNSHSNSIVSGVDFYGNEAGRVGYWTRWAVASRSRFPGVDRGSVIMIVNGYNVMGYEATYESRLYAAMDAIVNGANGINFFSYCDDALFGCADPTRYTWNTYRNSPAYPQIKQVATFLKNIYPALIGSTIASIRSDNQTVKLLAKAGTDHRDYILLVNEADSIQTVRVTGDSSSSSGMYENIVNQAEVQIGSDHPLSIPAKSVLVARKQPITLTPSPTQTLTPTLTPSPTATTTPSPSPTPLDHPGDLNQDDRIDEDDIPAMVEHYGKTECNNVADLNNDCKIDAYDYSLFIGLIESNGR